MGRVKKAGKREHQRERENMRDSDDWNHPSFTEEQYSKIRERKMEKAGGDDDER